MENFNFGENLRKVRLSTGISQEAMALMLEISQKSYSRLEHRHEIPSDQQVASIADALGVQQSMLRPLPPQKAIVAYPLKELLNMRGGGIVAFAAAIVIVISAHGFAEALCYQLGASEEINFLVRVSVAFVTGVYLYFKIKAVRN